MCTEIHRLSPFLRPIPWLSSEHKLRQPILRKSDIWRWERWINIYNRRFFSHSQRVIKLRRRQTSNPKKLLSSWLLPETQYMEHLTMSTSRQPTPWWLSKCKKRVLAPLMSFRRCHSNWKPKNLKQMHRWRYLGHEYQRFLGMLHRTHLCGQMSLRDSCRFLQCQLCPVTILT